MVTYLVIFGAAVKPDGTPSGTLLRRVEGALRASEDAPGCVFLGTGRVGRHGPAEGEAIAALLAARGVPQSRILVEREAGDTLESALYCHEILRHQPPGLVITCSSNYHNARCAVLLRLLGHRVRIPTMPADLPHLGWPKWSVYVLKELLALPYDVMVLFARGVGRGGSVPTKE